MKEILVLGGTRFVGRRLVTNLVKAGYEVTVANRSGLGDLDGTVRSIIFERSDIDSIKTTVGKNHYDAVFDMICYSPHNAKVIVKNISTDKYIMISSSVVYDWGHGLKEEDFVAEDFLLRDGTIEELAAKFGYKQGYKIGKMGAEHIIATQMNVPAIRVRFPVVMGLNDHTRRMESYVEAVQKKKRLYVDNLYSQFSTVYVENAAKYLENLLHVDYQGAINIADEGCLSVNGIVGDIGLLLGKSIEDIFEATGMEGGYNQYYNNTFVLDRMKQLGIEPDSVESWYKDLLVKLTNNWKE